MIEHENQAQKHKGLNVVTQNEILSHQGPTHGPNFIADNERNNSPKESMRDTQQSFASFSRSQAGEEPETPMSGARIRRSLRHDYGQTDTGTSWNRQNSEIRSSRRHDQVDLKAGGFNRMDSMQVTGDSWLARRARQAEGAEGPGMLPDINPRRPAMGESF